MLKCLRISFLIAVLLMIPTLSLRADLFVLGGVWSGTFTTYNSGGALTNADSTPSCQSFIGSSSTAVNTGTVTNISTGLYRYQITMSAGNGFAAGSSYSNLCTAVLGGVTQIVHKQDGIYLLATPSTAGVLSVDVGRWLNSVPNGLTSGRVDTTVGAMQADVVTAASIAANAIGASEIATDAVTEIQTNLLTFPKNVALANYGFYLSKAGVDYNIGTNATITCERIQDAGTFANCDAASQASITFKAKGVYNMTIAATDMNANKVWIRLYVPADSAVNVWQQQLIPGH
jgi:hypothetical protein